MPSDGGLLIEINGEAAESSEQDETEYLCSLILLYVLCKMNS